MKKTNYENYLESEIQKDSSLKTGIEMSKDAIQIAQRLYDLRKSRKMTQEELANLIDVRQSNISRLESGDYNSYTYKTIHKVADALRARLNIELIPMEKTETVTTIYKLTQWITSVDFKFRLSRATNAASKSIGIKPYSEVSAGNQQIWI